MSAPRWTLREVGPGSWWITEWETGAALKLGEADALHLWSLAGDQRLRPWREARDEPAVPDGTFVDLEFLGVRARYWCAEAFWAEEIARQYCSLIPGWRRSPDVEVRLGADADVGRLHRSVPDVRNGVELREVGAPCWQAGSAVLPILPLLQASALRGRFFALHAALLSSERGGVLVCGEQKAGKTSSALIARDLGLASILADETVLIDRDATAVGVPLPVRERSGSARSARALDPVPARLRRVGMDVSDVVVLEQARDKAELLKVQDDVSALRLIVPHLRVLDLPLGEVTDRLLGLLQACRLWRCRVRAWPHLREDTAAWLEKLLA